MSVITLDNEFVHYEVLGRGKPIVFLHGWVGSWRYWVPTMQTASFSFRAYSLDLWGYGDSAKKASLYTLDHQVSLLEGFLDNLGIGKIALIGHGLGAIVAAMFTAKYAVMVDRLMLTTFPLAHSGINRRLETSSIPELTDWLLVNSQATEIARIEAPKADIQAMLTSLSQLPGFDLSDLVNSLKTPCLFVYGQNDPVVELPPPEMLSILPEHMHSIIFEQSGHFPMLDETNQFNRLMSDFLALNSGESPRQLQLKEEWKRRVR